MVDVLSDISSQLGLPLYGLIIVMVWSLAWKAITLWKSGRRGHGLFFASILIINTLGIYEVIYFFVSKIKIPSEIGKSSRTWKLREELYLFGWIFGALNVIFWFYQIIAYSIYNRNEKFFSKHFHRRVFYWGIISLLVLALIILVVAIYSFLSLLL